MKTRTYKATGEEISLLGLGCMRLPLAEPGKSAIDEEKAMELVDIAYKGGINYYDTAWFYHERTSESFMGRALSRYPRDSFKLATKMPVSILEKAEDVPAIFAKQLENLQTDHFDFYLCHALNASNFEKMESMGVYEFLKQKKDEGIIKQLGFSFHDSADVLRTICDAHEWDFAQIQLNYLDWEMQDSAGQYKVLEEHGIPVIIMEPVRGGTLADLGEEANAVLKAAHPDWSIAGWALRYAASLPAVMTVLSGMSNNDQLLDNLGTFESFEPLSEADQAVLAEALAIFRRNTFVPCTSCRYCSECPQSIDIPTVFKRYNSYMLHKNAEIFKKNLEKLDEGCRPADCIGCGLCESMCPQHIAIPAKMQEIAAL